MQHSATLTSLSMTARRTPAPRRSRAGARATLAARTAIGVLLTATLVVSIISFTRAPDAAAPSSWGTVSVHENGTLWGIAETHPVEGRSTAETVELICAENGLQDGTIHPGQVLRVPGSEPAVALALR